MSPSFSSNLIQSFSSMSFIFVPELHTVLYTVCWIPDSRFVSRERSDCQESAHYNRQICWKGIAISCSCLSGIAAIVFFPAKRVIKWTKKCQFIAYCKNMGYEHNLALQNRLLS